MDFNYILAFILGICFIILLRNIKIEKIKLDPLNRMARIGFGKHNGIWFFRIDLWFVGFRIK